MLVELTAAERHAQEVALPAIFASGFNPARIDWYTRLCVESERIRGGVEVIPEFVAAMIGESSLNNRALGDANPDPHFGVGWCQLDTGYHATTHERIIAIRSDPLWSLTYITDPANKMVRHEARRTWFATQLWHAWEPARIDPVTGWSPLAAAYDAWERVT
jgi:hypothetical protein